MQSGAGHQVKLVEEWLVDTVGVAEDDGFLLFGETQIGERRGELVKGPVASWQNDKDISEHLHGSFAVVEVTDGYGCVVQGRFNIASACRHNADDLCSRFFCGQGCGFHQSGVHPPVDE